MVDLIPHLAGLVLADLTFMFPDGLIAHFHVIWIAAVKIRQTFLYGSETMVVFDDLDAGGILKVYDKGVTFDETPNAAYERRGGYRAGDM